MVKLKVVCLNDKNKPKEIDPRHWVKEGTEYNVLSILVMERQKGIFGFVLQEIDLPEDCPYDSFDSRRFGVVADDKSLADSIEEWLNEETEKELVEVERN